MSGLGVLSYRQIQVGRFMVGMSGLAEVFAALHAEGYTPDEAAARALLARARQHNYIPLAAEGEYAQALLREFRRFYRQQVEGCPSATDYGTWRDHPREHIPWYPQVNAGRCDACGACVRFCPNGVFAPADDGAIQVVEPYKCQVGCSACARVCKPRAITFPPPEVLEAFGEKRKSSI